MTRNEKDTINRRTENRYLLQRMKRGLEAVRDTPYKRALLAAYLVGAVLVWLFRAYLFGLDTYGMFSPVLEGVINLLLPLYAWAASWLSWYSWGHPGAVKQQRRACRKSDLSTMRGGPCPHSQAAGHRQSPADGLGV